MNIKRHGIGMILGLVIGAGGASFLVHPHGAVAKDEKMTNADYARDAQDHLKKAHEDVDHLLNSDADKKAKGYADADEAKKAIDRADKALGRYVGTADAAPAKK